MKTLSIAAFAKKAVLLALICAASSCGKKEDAAPGGTALVELPPTVIGAFTGQLSYTSATGSSITNATDGRATLAKTGDKTYSLSFSDAVPTITNLKFQSGASGAYASVGSDGSTAGMTLSANSMTIGVSKSAENWAFTGTK